MRSQRRALTDSVRSDPWATIIDHDRTVVGRSSTQCRGGQETTLRSLQYVQFSIRRSFAGMHLLVMALLSSTLCAAVPVDWPANGRTQREEHFSPLTKINAGNVGALGLAWQFDDFVVRGRTHRGNEASPLFTDGVLYFSGPWSVVYAVDARTGRLRWRYDPHVAGQWAGHGCCDVVNRGVALWHGRVYVATFDGFLVALDARDGREQWRVDTFTDRTSMNYSITGAPRIAGRNVLIGNGGAEMGARGYVSAFDLETGRLTWRFFTVPGDPAKGPDEDSAVTLARRTWSPESRWDLGGGGTAWDSMVYDAQLDLVYVGTGNGCPHPVWTRSPGGGDNLYLSSIVALDAQTGTLRWHYQTTPGDSWDYTATQNIILADLKIDGKMRQVLMQAPKNGFFYVLDRVTGELLSADPYTRVTWADRVDLTSGRPVMSTQADFSTESKLIWPSQAGGHNWMPMAFSPATGLVYIPTLEMPMNFGVTPGAEVRFRPGANNEGDVVSVPAQSIPQLATVLKAWDPVARRTVWQAPAGPFWGGGALSTAGGVVFAGAADGSFTAYDARSGKVLRRILTGIGTNTSLYWPASEARLARSDIRPVPLLRRFKIGSVCSFSSSMGRRCALRRDGHVRFCNRCPCSPSSRVRRLRWSLGAKRCSGRGVRRAIRFEAPRMPTRISGTFHRQCTRRCRR